jgi:hypothetical protein
MTKEQPYRFISGGSKLVKSASPLLRFVKHFDVVTGYTAFGDLFLQQSNTREFAVLIASTLELIETGETDEHGFRGMLQNANVTETLLRPRDFAALLNRLGPLAEGEVFYPVPLPALGGSGSLDTYDKGQLWEYLAIVAQTIN